MLGQALKAPSIAQMRKLDPAALTVAATAGGFFPFGVVDGEVLPQQMVDAFDRGEQARVPVLPADDPDALAARVLAIEHPLMLACLQLLCAGRITLRDTAVELDGRPLQAPLQLAANRLQA